MFESANITPKGLKIHLEEIYHFHRHPLGCVGLDPAAGFDNVCGFEFINGFFYNPPKSRLLFGAFIVIPNTQCSTSFTYFIECPCNFSIQGRSSQNVGYKYACFVMALTFRPQSIETIGPGKSRVFAVATPIDGHYLVSRDL